MHLCTVILGIDYKLLVQTSSSIFGIFLISGYFKTEKLLKLKTLLCLSKICNFIFSSAKIKMHLNSVTWCKPSVAWIVWWHYAIIIYGWSHVIPSMRLENTSVNIFLVLWIFGKASMINFAQIHTQVTQQITHRG